MEDPSKKDDIPKLVEICSGDGTCLRQGDTLTSYEKDKEMICHYNCQAIRCPNYDVCQAMDPQCILDCHHGLCTHCDIFFGTWQGGKGILPIINSAECPICLETTRCISLPKCNHSICIDCFKRCFYGENEEDLSPKFPYGPEIENEYDQDPNAEKWKTDPLIIRYNFLFNIYDYYKDMKWKSEEHLRHCPLCRK